MALGSSSRQINVGYMEVLDYDKCIFDSLATLADSSSTFGKPQASY